MPRPNYDFDHPIFKTKRNWLLYAKEHVDLWDLQENSDVIEWTVQSTVGSLEIPTVYHVTYHLRTITGIDAEAQPIYGDRHVMELTIPTRYPLVPASIFMRTDVWHPNIQSVGRFKGKICGNVNSYGIDYSLRQLVLRVGEILQYKNYLADFVPPYPEDPKVAEWVKAYGEPRNIVNRKEGIFTDDQPLIRPIVRAAVPPPADTPVRSEMDRPEDKPAPQIRIGKRTQVPDPPRRTIRIGGNHAKQDKS
ncbi:ubiquitin-conjugating enzyme [Neolewinella xylanilytica]|uniref:Ubiquitin-conjugating enzyme n=1 Tax=Neolewinella xylanilytica TaxID=1514080 RepID=A0A2S6IBC3_9BACT|nr:ubiquitin-conjugating enzyme E2 [Neolewinella xylanilytica]PPK88785.1 ubiquitin-conjugating enzyme [Neolewinella xylanilytica]